MDGDGAWHTVWAALAGKHAECGTVLVAVAAVAGNMVPQSKPAVQLCDHRCLLQARVCVGREWEQGEGDRCHL